MTLARVAGWCFIMDTCVIVTARHQAKQGERIVSQATGDGEHLAVMLLTSLTSPICRTVCAVTIEMLGKCGNNILAH